MRRIVVSFVALVCLQTAIVVWRRRNPRAGTAWVNGVVDPWLVREGIVDKSEGELGLIEHVGRTSGIVRVSPVHPVATEDGFRIVVPLGVASQWAANVVAAGRCRLQIGGVVHELDRPSLVPPPAVAGMPPYAARMMDGLGFRYLLLHRVSEAPGMLTADELAAA
jgi:F420H(2)-dependent quinone reductase